MRQQIIDVDLDAMDRDGISLAQNITAATPLLLNGPLGATLDYARIIGVYSGADLSTSTFTILGTNAHGESQTEVIATGPSGSTVVSVKLYKTITSIIPGATIASNVEVGTVATTLSAESDFVTLDHYLGTTPTYFVDVTGTINYTISETFMDPNLNTAANLTYMPLAAHTAKTADTVAVGTLHAMGLKVIINSYSTGAELQVYINQGNMTY